MLQAVSILKGVEQTSSSIASAAKKRTRPSNSPPKMVSVKSEDLIKHTSPTLQSSSAVELEAVDSLEWPTTGPFTYHRWHVMVERWVMPLALSMTNTQLWYHECKCVCTASAPQPQSTSFSVND